MEISKDSMATLLLCSDIALTEGAKPYTQIQWYKLAEKLWTAKLSPKDLFEIEDTSKQIMLDSGEIERIKRLLDRAGQFGIVLSLLNEKQIFTLTKSDNKYPMRLKNKLKKYAPPVLFYSGNLNLLDNDSIAIVGSRNIELDAIDFTEILAKKCVNSGLNIVSGGARGVDSIAENVSNKFDGTSIIFVADSLEKKIRNKETRNAIMKKDTLILSSQRPDLPFKVYTAMDRNKYIYAMANYVVAVSSDANKGGTWTGAAENLKNGWTPLFVRDGDNMPKGNRKLLEIEGVCPIRTSDFNNIENILTWFDDRYKLKVSKEKFDAKQMTIFDLDIEDKK